jgi:hypothetical protein
VYAPTYCAPVDKTAWLRSLDSGDYSCVGILPPQHNPKCHRRSTSLLDHFMRGITPEERDEIRSPSGYFLGRKHALYRQHKTYDQLVGAVKPNEEEGKLKRAHQGSRRVVAEVTALIRHIANPTARVFHRTPLRHLDIRRKTEHSSWQKIAERMGTGGESDPMIPSVVSRRLSGTRGFTVAPWRGP